MKLLPLILTMTLTLTLGACAPASEEHDEHDHGDAHAEPEIGKGPHNGRMLRKGDLALELAIFEDGVPPQFRAWLTRDGKPVAADSANLKVVLTRLGGTTDTHIFKPAGDFLVGDAVVYEPHSFDVTVQVNSGTSAATWNYESYEGRTHIAADIAKQAGIEVAPASAGVIRDEHDVQGLLTPIEGRHAKVVARFPGPIRSVSIGVGDVVAKGQMLATIESNLSLSTYAITAPLAGTVLSRDAGVGELAGDAALFEIADLSRLWVDLHLFGADAQHITPGLPVQVTRLSDGVTAATRLDRVLPATATASQSTVARATLDNSDGRWRPGAAVKARVTVAETPVQLAVPLAALQRFRDWDVVFIRVGDDYEIRPLELGQRDGVNVEVLSGLNAGDAVVVAQSYLIKADIEKSGASHDH
jgi:membrane fusion protein, heavy metal efflux system